MSKKTIKLISIITIILSIMMVMTVCFAADIKATNINGQDSDTDVSTVGTIGNKIATIIRNIGIVLAVIMLMVLGIKYMLGSAEEKAEYKKTMIPYLIGAVLLFAAATIAQAVVAWSSSIG